VLSTYILMTLSDIHLKTLEDRDHSYLFLTMFLSLDSILSPFFPLLYIVRSYMHTAGRMMTIIVTEELQKNLADK
jgi:hypothetical protein